jgi:pheromone shutdown protein TraB
MYYIKLIIFLFAILVLFALIADFKTVKKDFKLAVIKSVFNFTGPFSVLGALHVTNEYISDELSWYSGFMFLVIAMVFVSSTEYALPLLFKYAFLLNDEQYKSIKKRASDY